MTRLLVLVSVAAALLTGCAGRSCDELPALTAERDAARQDYLALARPGASPAEVTEPADAELHAIERQVLELEQRCAGT